MEIRKIDNKSYVLQEIDINKEIERIDKAIENLNARKAKLASINSQA